MPIGPRATRSWPRPMAAPVATTTARGLPNWPAPCRSRSRSALPTPYSGGGRRGVSVRWLVRRGQIAMQANRVDEADKLFRGHCPPQPGHRGGLRRLGGRRQNRGDPRRAMASTGSLWSKSQERGGDGQPGSGPGPRSESGRRRDHPGGGPARSTGHLGASINLALIRLDQGQGDAALRIADSALSLQPTNTQLLETRQGLRPARAARCGAGGLEGPGVAGPGDPNAVAQQAAAAMAAGRRADAVALLRRGLATFPESALIQGTLAWELATAPDASQRSRPRPWPWLARSPRGCPARPKARSLLAAALAETGNWPAAAAAAGGRPGRATGRRSHRSPDPGAPGSVSATPPLSPA